MGGAPAKCATVPPKTRGVETSVNLLRQLALIASSSALCLAVAPGCGPKKPNGTTPPTTSGGAGGDGGASADGGGDGGGDGAASADGGGDPGASGDGGGDSGGTPAETCEAKVADPALLFSSSILIRPPHGVEFLPDDGNPTFTQAIMSGGFISACDANIKRINMLVFPHDKKKGVEGTLKEFVESLAAQGYQGGKDLGVKHEAKGEKHVAWEFPAQGGQPASVLYIAAAVRTGATVPPIDKIDNVFVVVYETTPADFKLLEPSFAESGKSIFIVPPD